MPTGARVQASCGRGPWATWCHVSPLWTLQRLCFGPDVAAACADRGENRDPGTAAGRSKKLLTREMRLENGPLGSRGGCKIWRRVDCGHVCGLFGRYSDRWPR